MPVGVWQSTLIKHSSSKKTTRENVSPLLISAGDLETRDTEKPKVFRAFFTLVFTGKTHLMESQVHVTTEKIQTKRDFGKGGSRTIQELCWYLLFLLSEREK